MRKTHEKTLRTLLAFSVLATAMLSSGCLDDEEMRFSLISIISFRCGIFTVVPTVTP